MLYAFTRSVCGFALSCRIFSGVNCCFVLVLHLHPVILFYHREITSDSMGQLRVHHTGPWVKFSCLSPWIHFDPRMGQNLGQLKALKINSLKKCRKAKETSQNP